MRYLQRRPRVSTVDSFWIEVSFDFYFSHVTGKICWLSLACDYAHKRGVSPDTFIFLISF